MINNNMMDKILITLLFLSLGGLLFFLLITIDKQENRILELENELKVKESKKETYKDVILALDTKLQEYNNIKKLIDDVKKFPTH